MDVASALPVLIGLITGALAFDFLNGLHDAANSIATIVSTRVLRPQYAVAWAAFFNFIAFLFFGLHVANTLGTGIIAADVVDPRLGIRFQMIAPISAPDTSRGSTTSAAVMPEPRVVATCRPKNRKAMKLKNAAQATAYCGRSTRVETMVAMELAASCSPLRKSKASATAIRPISTGKESTASMGLVLRRGYTCSM